MLFFAFVGCELEAHLSHSLRSFTRLGFLVLPIFASSVAVLLIQLLSATLTLLLEAFNNVDSSAGRHRERIIVLGEGQRRYVST